MERKSSRNIPKKLKRDLMREAGWRCAVPTCRETTSLDVAHITSIKDNGGNTFDNLIVLCANCHRRFDCKDKRFSKAREKYMTREEMIILKQNLMVLSGRYSSFERRVLEWFVEEENTDTIQCWGRDFDLMYLIKDGFIIDSGARSQNSLNFPPKIYRLTDSGKEFVEKWKTAKLLN